MPLTIEDSPDMTRTERERAESARYSANVRAELARKGMRHEALVELAELPSVDALRRRLGGRAVWTAGELERVARALGVPLTRLTQGGDEQP